MADPTAKSPEPQTAAPAAPRPRRAKRKRLRRGGVQTAFLLVWLAPLGRWLHSVPSCVFHCYACPLSSFACPVGVVAQFAAVRAFPFIAVGVLFLVGGLVGSLVCGWACPFGFIQDLLNRIPTPKFRIPNWLGHGRYVMLLGAVIAVPYLWGNEHPLFICSICPAGAAEAGLPRTVIKLVDPTSSQGMMMGAAKWALLGAFVFATLFTYRPWCKVFCPLGGFLALFNRVSVFHMTYNRELCTECNTCRSRCTMGVPVEAKSNSANCIRCTECTTCGAIQPMLAKLKKIEKR